MTESSKITNIDNTSSLLLIPNLIGYCRIVLLIGVVLFALAHPVLTVVLYFISGNLDAIDGLCARKLNQESRIGIILDYAIDRASVVVLFMILSILYVHEWEFFCFLLMLDIFSHICQVYSTVFMKLNSHKSVGKQQGLILRLYYSNRSVLYFACASHDLWLACLYLYYFYPLKSILYISLIFLPGFIFKVIIHLSQITSVFKTVSQNDYAV